VFWIARSAAQWRDFPEEFGKWKSVYHRFRDWGVAGVFGLILVRHE
jgi:transposase